MTAAVLITGATDGIGLGLARLYAAEGVRRVLVPGLGSNVFAFLGRHLPRVTERGMRKAIDDKLP